MKKSIGFSIDGKIKLNTTFKLSEKIIEEIIIGYIKEIPLKNSKKIKKIANEIFKDLHKKTK